MRYFIAHLVDGSVAQYHRTLVEDVAAQFNLEIIRGQFPTHITLKAPFESDDAVAIKNVLKKFMVTHYAQPFTICGFGHFQNKVVFLDVELPQNTSRVVKELQWALNGIHDIQWGAHEPLENLHVTIAKKSIAEKFDSIWEYLCEKEPLQFDLLLDNVALLRFENDAWVVDSVYVLNL